MDAPSLQAVQILISLVTLLGGAVLAYVKFFRDDKKQTSDGMYDRALRIIQSYETDMARKNQEIRDLRRQVEYLTEHMQLTEQRNAKLIQALAQAWKVPEALIEMRLEGSFPSRRP